MLDEEITNFAHDFGLGVTGEDALQSLLLFARAGTVLPSELSASFVQSHNLDKTAQTVLEQLLTQYTPHGEAFSPPSPAPVLLTLGGFSLGEVLGQGGMGEVWAGTHDKTGLPVAVKVIHPNRDAKPLRWSIAQEVRVMAALSHPNIVIILDQGTIPVAVARASRGRLRTGSPAYAMERGQESLQSFLRRQQPDWRQARGILLQILSALSHAHARSVTHLDIKPANVLRFCDTWKLADFGMAHIAGDTRKGVGGTMGYMAPEQRQGRDRELGPWTDLFAVGCVAWRLLTASVPRVGFPFSPVVEVPAAVRPWLKRLLAEQPSQRFRSAAHAAHALQALDASAPLRVPPQWRRTSRPSPAPKLLGAGLGLYGLREIPLVARHHERDTLWGALCAVVDHGRPRCVLLKGTAGCGKSRLARWISELAVEVGAAQALHTAWGNSPGPTDGLVPMLVRHLRTAGLTRPQVAARAARLLALSDPHDVGALAELLHPISRKEDPAGVPVVPLKTPEQRLAVVARALSQLAQQQPLVLWLDDIQWGERDGQMSATALAEVILASTDRILLVLTQREGDDVEETPPRLAQLRGTDGVETLPVGELVGADRVALIEGLLGLSGALAEEVAARTGGNPLFAVQLVGDWVERGILEAGKSGFELVNGARVSIPDAIHDLWKSRLDRLMMVHDPATRRALEVAAVLGVSVEANEWRAVCTEAGVSPSMELVEAMQQRGLATPSPGGWSFSHSMLIESISRVADERGRLDEVKRAAGRVLLEQGKNRQLRGENLLAEGFLVRAEAALRNTPHQEMWAESLNALARTRMDQGCLEEVEVGLARALDAARQCAQPALEGVVLGNMALLEWFRGNYSVSEEHYRAALAIHRQQNDRRGEANSLGNLGLLVWHRGDRSGAMDLYTQALALHRQQGNRNGESSVLGNMGIIYWELGQYEAAMDHYQRALHISREVGNRLAEGNILTGMSNLYIEIGRLEKAEATFQEALTLQRELGNRRYIGVTLDNMGILAMIRNCPEEGRVHFEEALAIHREVGNRRQEAVSLHNLGEYHLKRGEFDQASAVLEEAITIAESIPFHTAVGLARGTQGLVLVRLGQDATALESLRVAEEHAKKANDRGRCLGLVLCRRAEVMVVLARPEHAQAALERARDLARQTDCSPTSDLGRAIVRAEAVLRGG